LLGDLLDETYGIMVYQEDVSKAAVALAGFSHAEADGLRKVMSKKDKELALRDYFEQFTRGARARGVTGEQIRRIWDMILSFSGYSFCKPPQRQLCASVVPGRVFESALSGRIHGRRDQ
jgi:DNA polymerase III alpha subunit